MLPSCQSCATITTMDAQDVTPREPTQERSRRTVRRLLREADRLLPEMGITEFSMITLAEDAGVNRATAYRYFPTKYAVFNALAEQYLDGYLALVRTEVAPASDEGWRATIGRLIELTGVLYQREPTARLLFLGGGVSQEIDTAHHQMHNQRVAALMRELVEADPAAPGLRDDPDPYLLVVEAVIAVLATSHRMHGSIVASYTGEATALAVAYLEACQRS